MKNNNAIVPLSVANQNQNFTNLSKILSFYKILMRAKILYTSILLLVHLMSISLNDYQYSLDIVIIIFASFN
jgi:hypothetical protein